MVTYSWSDLRWKVLRRDDFRCVKCGKAPEYSIPMKDEFNDMTNQTKEQIIENAWSRVIRFDTINDKIFVVCAADSELTADHIKPIALGGDEWDMKNIQTLCIDCNKIKTAEDRKKIDEQRKREKVLIDGQTKLGQGITCQS
jgi:5-methylcytosine-specific restriction endonuclease McrA